MIYYFIMYVWRSSLNCEGQLQHAEIFTKIHPIKWLIEERKNHSKELMSNNKLVTYEYWLLGWKEVSQEIYDTYKDEVG